MDVMAEWEIGVTRWMERLEKEVLLPSGFVRGRRGRCGEEVDSGVAGMERAGEKGVWAREGSGAALFVD